MTWVEDGSGYAVWITACTAMHKLQARSSTHSASFASYVSLSLRCAMIMTSVHELISQGALLKVNGVMRSRRHSID